MAKAVITSKNYLTVGAGEHSCGDNLFLVVKEPGGRNWSFRWEVRLAGKRMSHKMGLGSAKDINFVTAKDNAHKARRMVIDGIDPRRERDEKRRDAEGTQLFSKFAEQYRVDHEQALRSSGARSKLKRLIQVTCKPLHGMRMDEIQTAHIKSVLDPIWHKQDTAKDARQAIERIFNAANALGFRKEANPASWKSQLEHVMPKLKKSRQHLKALPYTELPALTQRLAKETARSVRAMEILIMTMSRTIDIVRMRWSQIDLEAGIWTLPADKMLKNDRAKVTPLPRQALDYLRSIHGERFNDVVFPGKSLRKPMTNKAMLQFIKKLTGDPDFTVHGFRSTFRTWAQEETNFDRETVEHCMHHILGDEAERAYKRGDALKKRREVMQAFADFAIPPAKTFPKLVAAA